MLSLSKSEITKVGYMFDKNWVIILSVSTIVTVVATYSYIRSIMNDSSSTAAIAYILVPPLILLVFGFTSLFVFSVLSLISVFVGKLSPVSISAWVSYLTIVVSVAFTLKFVSLQSLSKPGLHGEELEKRYASYKKSVGLIRTFAEGFIMENPNVTTTILEDQVKSGNYQATRHPNLSTESIDNLIQKLSLSDWGIISNLSMHPNISKESLLYLSKKTETDFKNKEDWKSFKQYVLPGVVSNPKISSQ